MKPGIFIVIIMAALASGCASNSQVADQASASNNDPLESVNRSIWDFNKDVLDKHILKPVTVAYVENTPELVREGLLNAADNLEEPGYFLNNLLQGKVKGSLTSISRFVVNSSIGLLGLIDVAGGMGLEQHEEDFGQTLGVWGLDTGPYLMLPALGPSDPRSATGDVVDRLYWPINDLNVYLSVFTSGIQILESRAAVLSQDQLLNDSLDSYAFVKDIYFQNLANKVADGAEQDVDDMSEEDEELDALLEEF